MVGRVEDFVAKRDDEYPPHELSDFDRKIIGGDATRIEIPFTGRYQLRQIAGILRGYADKVDLLTRQHDMTDRSLLLTLKMEARAVNMQIREVAQLTGKGKKPRPYRRGEQ